MTSEQAKQVSEIVLSIGNDPDAGVFLTLDVRNMADGTDGIILTSEMLDDDQGEHVFVTVIAADGSVIRNEETN